MAHVLLLNASYEPLAVVTQRRALALLIRDRVEAASTDSIALQGATATLEIPNVIRLKRYINVPQRGTKWSRRGVLRRDHYICVYCGIRADEMQRGRMISRSDFTVDHILPLSRGGKSIWSNTACACASCNQRKGNRTPHEANLKLRWEPKTPRVNYLVATGDVPAAWKLYLKIPQSS